jgi:hypothetical protein
MPAVFTSRPGAVVAITDPVIMCSAQFMKLNPNITFGSQRSIVTRLTVSQQVNLQFLHTLGSLIYVYVFGDRMGTVSLSGLAFACAPCAGQSLPLYTPGMAPLPANAGGMEQMLLWYKTNRASKLRAPVQITIGSTVIEGFVTSFTEDVVDPATQLVQWGVSLASLPPDS